MNREDIIRMAREAGLSFNQNLEELSTPFCDGVHCEDLERFATLVAAAEREACAELVESRKTGANELMDAVRDMEAAAIRAKSKHE